MKLTPIYETAKRLNAEFTEQGGWQVAQKYVDVEAETAGAQTQVALCDLSHNGKIRIEGNTAGVMLEADELAIGATKESKYGPVYRLRQDLFFVSTNADSVGETAVTLAKQASDGAGLITVTDVTQGNAEIWLIGPNSAELLSRLCGLDFDDSQFPDGTAKQSSVAKTTQLIIRRDIGDHKKGLVFALIGFRSQAAYLWQTIIKAGGDLGIQPIGLAAVSQLPITD